MKMLSLVLRILACLGAVTAIVLFVLTQNKVKDITASKSALQQSSSAEISTLTEARDSLERQLRTAQNSNSKLNDDLADARSQVTNATTRLTQATRDVDTAQAALRSQEEENKRLSSRVSDLSKELLASRTELEKADSVEIEKKQEEIDQLVAQLRETRDRLETAQSQIADLERRATETATIATTTTPTRPQQAVPTLHSPSTPATSTATAAPQAPTASFDSTINVSILSIDTRNGLIAVSGGSANSSLQPNMEAAIIRGGVPVARVRFSDVRPEFSLGYILPGATGINTLKKGDTITLAQ